MDRVISDFKELLQNEIKVYSTILDLSKRKREAITQNDINGLDAVVREEQALISVIGALEERRKESTDRLAALLGLNPARIKLKDIIEKCPQTDKNELELLHKELLSIVDEQIELNRTNELLIKSKLEYIDFIMDIASSSGGTSTYGSEGKETPAGRSTQGMIDFKI